MAQASLAKRPVKRFALLFALWLVLSQGRLDGVVFGVAAAAGAAWFSAAMTSAIGPRFGLYGLLRLAPGFFWRSLAGGTDVAWRALQPRMPLNPGWTAYSCRLPGGAMRVALGGELSLMPGTLVAGSDGDRLLVHCLDIGGSVEEALRAEEDRLEAAIVP